MASSHHQKQFKQAICLSYHRVVLVVLQKCSRMNHDAFDLFPMNMTLSHKCTIVCTCGHLYDVPSLSPVSISESERSTVARESISLATPLVRLVVAIEYGRFFVQTFNRPPNDLQTTFKRLCFIQTFCIDAMGGVSTFAHGCNHLQQFHLRIGSRPPT